MSDTDITKTTSETALIILLKTGKIQEAKEMVNRLSEKIPKKKKYYESFIKPTKS